MAGRGLTKDTVLCVSLSARPSNNGTRFHNFLYAELGLDYVYKAFAPTDLAAAVAGIRGLGIRGAGVSMPFKEDVIALVDELHASAAAIDSVNTILNTAPGAGGPLVAHNTDYGAVAALLREHRVDPAQDVAVLGSGGMAKAVLAALRDHGHTEAVVVSRNERTGRALARRYDAQWLPELGARRPQLLAHATPVGMVGGPAEHDLPVEPAVVAAARTVLEVVASPRETPLVRAATTVGTVLITGGEVQTLQALEQFVLYTGVRPGPEAVARAEAHVASGRG